MNPEGTLEILLPATTLPTTMKNAPKAAAFLPAMVWRTCGLFFLLRWSLRTRRRFRARTSSRGPAASRLPKFYHMRTRPSADAPVALIGPSFVVLVATPLLTAAGTERGRKRMDMTRPTPEMVALSQMTLVPASKPATRGPAYRPSTE